MNLDDTLNYISTIVLTNTQYHSSQGTGFYYSRLAPRDGDRPQYRRIEDMWIVTNRHVLIPKVEDREIPPSKVTFSLRRINESGLLNWDSIVLSLDEISTLAKFHQDNSIDIAMINISELVYGRLDSGGKYVAPYFLSANDFADKNNIGVEASSDILVVGYPKGFYDSVNLFPIVKSGIIASRWGVGFKGRPYFLIDAKLFPGSSGSVVISKPIDTMVKDGRLMYSKEKKFAFLGVFSGEPKMEEDPVEIGDLTITRKSGFDLGIVWYAELVEDIIDKGIALSEALNT